MILRRTPLWPARSGSPPPAVTRAERRRMRRALLHGGELRHGDALRIARQLAGVAPLRLTLASLGGAAGFNLLSLSTTDGRELPFLVTTNVISVASLLFVAATWLWVQRIQRPAEAVGAVPTRVDGRVGRSG